MRLRTTLLCFACLTLAAGAAFASAAKPNFSGTWELDQSKSHSIAVDMKQTMTVVHDGDKVSVETKITGAQGERTQKDDYTLDGKESEFTQPAPPQAPPNTPPNKGKRKGNWLPNDKGFVIEEEIQAQTPQGPMTVIVARKWVMWPDGTMSIEIISESPRGTFNNKRVFAKSSTMPAAKS